MSENIRRLFFGLEAYASWKEVHSGRKVDSKYRHMTIAFLGDIDFGRLQENLNEFPKPPFSISPGGVLDAVSFLPKRHPTVVSYHVHLLQKQEQFLLYCAIVKEWLQKQGYSMDKRAFLPHVTVARAPFSYIQYRDAFSQIPVAFGNLHLYESKPNLVYIPCWTLPLLRPFQEIEHMTHRAYIIRGENWDELYLNAQLALEFPDHYRNECTTPIPTFDVLIQLLNQIGAGSSFKAIRPHDEVKKLAHGILEWKMIVDV